MNLNIDDTIRTVLLENDITIPEKCRKKLDDTILGLPDKVNKIRSITFWPKVAIVLVCLMISSITVFAAVDYVRQRMESLTKEEKDSYYEGVQNSPANADSYSREFTDNEKAKMEELRAKYVNGVFPAQKLSIVKTQSDADDSMEFYFVEDASLFVLPTRELTEEEILEIIDFYYSRDYSLTKKAKENIVTVSPDEFIEKGGMDEDKAIEMALLDIQNVYGLDFEDSQISVEYNDVGGIGNIYYVTMTDSETLVKYGASIDADQELVTQLFNMKQSSDITDGVAVDEAKFTAKYDDALDMLKKWKGEDVSITRATCEYNYNSDDCLEHGMVSYLFEMEDGTGYVFYYSCTNESFFQIFMTDYDQYRQRVDQDDDKRQKRGIVRKIIQMN
jgi:hypothetical protein